MLMACNCSQEGYYKSGVPGVLAMLGPNDLPVSMDHIQRCDVCKIYDSDAEAAFAYYSKKTKKAPSITPEAFLSLIEIDNLIAMYDRQPYAVDRLPYTTIFEAMARVINENRDQEHKLSNFTIYSCLMVLRKQERLPLKR